jgi:sterol desaturase/sphingolipid hydroxylase (fatty acid hydroxylase superfamily)
MTIGEAAELLAGAAAPVAILLLIYGVGPVVERLAGAQLSWPSMTLNLKHWFVTYAANAVLAPSALALSYLVVGALGGGWVGLPDEGWGLLWSIPLFVLASELAYYWFHRAQHAWSPLWAMHSLHHSDQAFGITTSIRHFWTEGALRTICVYPLVLIVFRPAPTAAAALIAFWSYFEHLDIRLSFGRAGLLLTSPQYHRIHHAAGAAYADHNFVAMLPLWDWVFGTYYPARRDEYPPTGIASGAEPRGILDAVLWPLVRLRRGAGVS